MKNVEIRRVIFEALQIFAEKKGRIVDDLASDIIADYLRNYSDDDDASRVQEIVLTNEDFEGLSSSDLTL